MVLSTGHTESDILHEAIAAGADGVLTKDMGVDHILDVVERAHRGDGLLDVGTLRDLMTQPSGGASRLAALDRLTPRERIVLEAVLAAGPPQAGTAPAHTEHGTRRRPTP